MLIIINPSIAVIWIVMVAVMFWKILFPINARLHQNLDKWIHALVPVLGENIIPKHSISSICHPMFIRCHIVATGNLYLQCSNIYYTPHV